MNLYQSEEEIKKQWNACGAAGRQSTGTDLVRSMHRRNLVYRLRRRAMMIAVLGLSGPLWIVWLSTFQQVSLLLETAYTVFMLVMGMVSLFWWYRLGDIKSLVHKPVLQAQQEVKRLLRLQRNIKIMGWITGIPIVSLLFYEIYNSGNEEAFFSCIVGAVIGAAIGLFLEYMNRRQLKEVQSTFIYEEPEDK